MWRLTTVTMCGRFACEQKSMEAKKSDYGTSGNSSSLQIETPPVISPTLTQKPTGTDNSSQFWIYSNFISCLIVGPLNFVSYKVMYAAYGESRAFFVSQGVNFLYVLYGGIILHYLTKKGEITEEMRAIPHLKFIVMGFLDCLGGFLAAMGANRTPGSLQQLLNQTLIPIIMFMSWFFLGKTSTYLQLIGASVILFGACVVIFPSTSEDENGSRTLTSTYDIISYLLYFSSNIPIAFSCIYKEMGFRNLQVHVMYMTQLVSIYQLLWGFVLGVLQMMPGIGSETGYSLSEINSSFWSGVLCFLEMDQVWLNPLIKSFASSLRNVEREAPSCS
jgi:drug/metabolite transporter (DMT)-like permease